MARRKIIAGNWKMNKTPSEAKALCELLIPLVKNDDVDVAMMTGLYFFLSLSPFLSCFVAVSVAPTGSSPIVGGMYCSAMNWNFEGSI